MAATTPSKPLLWSGIGVAAVGVAALLIVAFTDLGKADQIASVAGVVLAAVGLGLSLWAQFGRSEGAVEASGSRAVAAGGSIGAVVTGDGTQAPAAPPAMPSGGTPATGPVTASGERSVAAGGDIGSVSTGDA
ncbi:hypothetical protein [Streptomyces vietnamensis]|uniref:Uncharacterized protein n=1 Tax=Streptomyces vietnamensis TaxID=362257 RepID=A0A0B5HV63_9ACTN|nr:hypothetical protein [Streptomyces vietnamensis]AJF65920.1 hypothetical protein SVTN_17500 [Streptomyces vietnamensis]